MVERKKLIEVALPLEAINKACVREKRIRHGHPSTLHLWWARRPLVAARAVIFSSLVDDPDNDNAPPEFIEACNNLPKGKNAIENDTPRQRLFDFIEQLVTWEATTDDAIIEQARELIRLSTDGNPPPLLDPFSGGGVIPLEAQRLGLETHASDLNPVAVTINKALLEIIPIFLNNAPVNPKIGQSIGVESKWIGTSGLASDIEYYGKLILNGARDRIGHLYPQKNGEDVVSWLWARTVVSPNPAINSYTPLIRDFWLCKKKNKETWLDPEINNSDNSIRFKIKSGKGSVPESLIGRTSGTCIFSGAPIPLDYIKQEGKNGRLGTMMISIVTKGNGGRNYYEPSKEHIDIATQANPEWIPHLDISTHAQYMAPPRYGIKEFGELFMPRQLVALNTFSSLVQNIIPEITKDAINAGMKNDNISLADKGQGAIAYAQAIAVMLALTIDKLADLGNNLCPWEPKAECPRNLFGRQLMSMTWNFAEGNPLGKSSGSWHILINNLSRNIKKYGNFQVNLIPGTAFQRDATSYLGDRKFIISTDPPYYDNVPYADLSDFFYVWLRKNLKEIYPNIFRTVKVPKDTELVADYERWGGRDNANAFFEEGLFKAFTNILECSDSLYPVTIYYAFKQSELNGSEKGERTGWETMLEGVIQSGFQILGTWPLRTELVKALKSQMNFLASSIVLVCRPRSENAPITSRREFVSALRRELPAALREMQSGNIAPVDMAQASIGPGMAIYSRYQNVLEPNGNHLTVRTALQIINQELDAFLAEQEGHIDVDSRFAVAWFQQYGFEEGPFGQADVLVRAKDTSLEGLVNAGVLESGTGKVRLLHWSELDPSWDPTIDDRLPVWEATHHLIKQLNTYGEEGVASLLVKMSPKLAADSRQLAYRLYSICEHKSWAKHARDYNTLVVSWSASQEQAQSIKQKYQQEKLI